MYIYLNCKCVSRFQPFIRVFAVVLLQVASLATQAIAQNPSTIPNANPALSTQPLRFADYLTALHQKTGLAFVAEDTPMNLVPQEAIPLETLQAMGRMEAIEVVAARFDYTVQLRDRVCCLQKRFTDTQDLPCITMEECRLALRDTDVILSGFPVRITSGGSRVPYEALVASLSKEQINELAGGLAIASLNPQQRQHAKNFALYFYVGEPGVDLYNAILQVAAAPKATLQYQAVFGKRKFGFLFKPFGAPDFREFTSDDVNEGVTDTAGKRGSPGTNPAWQTLAEVVAGLNARPASSEAGRYLVDMSLATKRVTMVGTDAVSGEQLMGDLAFVYGLRVRYSRNKQGTSKGEVVTLLRPAIPPVRELADIPTALRTVLPLPLVRASTQQETDPLISNNPNIVAMLQKLKTGTPRERRQTQEIVADIHRGMLDSRLPTLKDEVGRRLEIVYRQHTKGKGTPAPVPIADLSDDERNTFAVVLLLPWMKTLTYHLSLTLPSYVAHFDEMYLQGGPYQDASGKFYYALSFCRRDPQTGDLSGVAGGTQLPYHPKPK